MLEVVLPDASRLSRFGFYALDAGAVMQGQSGGSGSKRTTVSDDEADYFPVLPGKVQFIAAACSQSLHATTCCPCLGQGREEAYCGRAVLMEHALHEHLHHAGRSAEVAVNLER